MSPMELEELVFFTEVKCLTEYWYSREEQQNGTRVRKKQNQRLLLGGGGKV